MIGKLIPLALALSGLGAGVGAGIALRPEPEVETSASPCGDVEETAPEQAEKDEGEPATTDFVKMENQFVIPVIEGDAVGALVVLSLSLEVASEQTENVYARIPKLRDGFLRVLLDHANVGGFDGAFTSNGSMDTLRASLTEVGTQQLGKVLTDVLILDINRQDL